MKKLYLVCLAVIILIGFFVRFYNLSGNPNSLSIDEVSFGYSAFSILNTARDENGVFLPLIFRSTGDYKSPVLIYSLVPAIALFGLNEFSVRLTTALLGGLTIPLIFLLTRSLTGNLKIALFTAGLLSISPWHVYYSRFAAEATIGLFFLLLGLWFFRKIRNGSLAWVFPSVLSLSLSIYSYHSFRYFVPFFLSVLLFLYFKKLGLRNLVILLLSLALVTVPLLWGMLFGGANTRAGMVFISNDIEYTRYVSLDHLAPQSEGLLLIFFWLKRYLNYFQADFLFFNGLKMTLPGSIGLGVFYLFELLWFVLGAVALIKGKIPNQRILILWVLTGIIPASMANNEQSAVRSLIILPPLLIISATGAFVFLQIFTKVKRTILRLGIGAFYIVFVVVSLFWATLTFNVHFPNQRGEAFMEGTKETVLYALNEKDKYKEIVYDPYRGIESPYIVNIPHMYILFYSKYDPLRYQTELKRFGNELFGFDSFTIRRIDWRIDRARKDTLFIGSPWSLPEKDISKEEILKRVYLQNGDLAFLIVSPKGNN